MKKRLILCVMLAAITVILFATGCDASEDQQRQKQVSAKLEDVQQTPTDVDYSLERYNLIKRAYWVNGMREKAMSLPCPIDKPLGYVVLFTGNGGIVGRFIVDGKLSSLNSMLTPVSTYYTVGSGSSTWLADVDGSYGDNSAGIFFFTPDGKYIEWNGLYLYSDLPFEISDPIVKIQNQ